MVDLLSWVSIFFLVFSVISLAVLEITDSEIASVTTSISCISLIIAVVLMLASNCIQNSKINAMTEEMTEITAYYDYADKDNYELITPEKLKETNEDDYYREIFVDDFGKVFIITDKSEKLFKPDIEKTEVKSSKPNGVIIPKYPDGFHGTINCKCTNDNCPYEVTTEQMSKSDIGG